MTNKLIRNLKTLFHNFIYYKEDDGTNIKKWLNQNITYNNGGFENQSNTTQTGTVEFSVWSMSPLYRLGDIKVTVTPGVSGQPVQYISTHVNTTTTTNSNGVCTVSGRFDRNSTVTIIVQPININGVHYKGCTLQYDT